MNNIVKCGVSVLIGAAIGSVITWYSVRSYYKNIADEEIESVKMTFSKRKHEVESEKNPDGEISEKVSSAEEHREHYKKLVSDTGYVNYSNTKELDGKELDLPSEDDNPFVEFVDDDQYGFEYDTESLDYYPGDDTVVNELGEIMDEDEINEAIGVDWKDRLINCGYDTVYVRNSYQEKDYEIVNTGTSWHEDGDDV